ncbi:MAG: amidohydrolase family protein [Pseudomonadales bacterium]
MALAEFVDAHHHLWALKAVHYPWLMATGQRRFFGDPTPIQRDYRVDDFLGEPGPFTPAASVHIQVGAQDPLAETAWLNNQLPFPHALVAFCDLAADDVDAQLAAQLSCAQARLRGVRQIVGRHEGEDELHGTDRLLSNPRWLSGLRLLESHALSFDLQLTPGQMVDALRVFERVPELPVALCHAGSPWDQSQEGLRRWRRGLEHFAELPNSVCKLSGLGMFKPDWILEDLKPVVMTVIDVFSPTRVMFGSNFPVDKLYRPYADYWSAYYKLTQGFSERERQAMFVGTARRFYRLSE